MLNLSTIFTQRIKTYAQMWQLLDYQLNLLLKCALKLNYIDVTLNEILCDKMK